MGFNRILQQCVSRPFEAADVARVSQFTFVVHHDVTRRGHPEALRPFIPEIDQFARHSHLHILDRILR